MDTNESYHQENASTLKDIPSYNPPRTSSSYFQHVKQTLVDYFLLVEFLPEDWSASLYRHLIDGGDLSPWYIRLSPSKKRLRLGAWKDSNLQFKLGLYQAA